MTNEITTAQPAPFKPSALAVMASRFSVEPAKLLNTLKNTVFKNATDDELLALVVVANEYGLNPLTKEIYAFPAKGGGIVPVVSVDGWNNMANSHSQMDGMDFEFEHDDNGQLVSGSMSNRDRLQPGLGMAKLRRPVLYGLDRAATGESVLRQRLEFESISHND